MTLGTHDKFYWIDFAGIDQDDPAMRAVCVRLMPMYFAVCQRVLVLDPGEVRGRAWPQLERLLGVAFCAEKSCVHMECCEGGGLPRQCEGRYGTELGVRGPWACHTFIPLLDPSGGLLSEEADRELVRRLFSVVLTFRPNILSSGWVHVDLSWGSKVPVQRHETCAELSPTQVTIDSTEDDETLSLSVVRTRSVPDTSTLVWETVRPWMLLSIAIAIHGVWIMFSMVGGCEDGTRQYFWVFITSYAGIWFCFSLLAMAALFRITLLDCSECMPAVCLGTGCSIFGLAAGAVVLYVWHIVGGRVNGTLHTRLVSRAILMVSVGIFGMCCMTLFHLHLDMKRLASCRQVLHRVLFPVIISCVWCALWLAAELFAQLFQPYREAAAAVVSTPWLPLAELAWVCSWSWGFLPLVRKMVGVAERHFLPSASSASPDAFAHTLRVLTWIDLLFDGFRWQYNRIVFWRMSTVSLCLFILKDVATVLYNFGFKYNPLKLLFQLVYLQDRRPLVAVGGQRLPLPVLWLRWGVRSLAFVDALAVRMFTSTVLRFHFDTGETVFDGGARTVLADTVPLATISVLNYRFEICQQPGALQPGTCSNGRPDRDAAAAATQTRGAPQRLSVKRFSEVLCSGLDEMDGWLRFRILLALQRHIFLRYHSRRTMKLHSAIILLLSNVTLGGLQDSVTLHEAGPLDGRHVRFWLFPLILTAVDLTEILVLDRLHAKWCFNRNQLDNTLLDLFGDRLFSVAKLGLLLHVSMSPLIGQHSMRFCTPS